LEFADFECPVCQSFANGALRAIRAQYPDKVAVIFRQWPLSYHRLAYPTARAAECAGAQERFEAFHDLVYSKQDSLGLKSYGQFAKDAGVPDLAAFETCNSSAAPIPSIEADIAAAKAVGGRGTPTILVNGLMLAGLPDSAKLEGYVQAAIRAAK
jgi:protein-disulfide isomerase